MQDNQNVTVAVHRNALLTRGHYLNAFSEHRPGAELELVEVADY